jgi:hypothetical protein
MSDQTTPAGPQDPHDTTDEVEIDDDALEMATGGQNTNSTMLVFASTFVPFDSSF